MRKNVFCNTIAAITSPWIIAALVGDFQKIYGFDFDNGNRNTEVFDGSSCRAFKADTENKEKTIAKIGSSIRGEFVLEDGE